MPQYTDASVQTLVQQCDYHSSTNNNATNNNIVLNAVVKQNHHNGYCLCSQQQNHYNAGNSNDEIHNDQALDVILHPENTNSERNQKNGLVSGKKSVSFMQEEQDEDDNDDDDDDDDHDNISSMVENMNKDNVDLERRLNPKSPNDFHVLYSELILWRNAQLNQLKKKSSPSNKGIKDHDQIEQQHQQQKCQSQNNNSPADTLSKLHILSQERKVLTKLSELRQEQNVRLREKKLEAYFQKIISSQHKWDIVSTISNTTSNTNSNHNNVDDNDKNNCQETVIKVYTPEITRAEALIQTYKILVETVGTLNENERKTALDQVSICMKNYGGKGMITRDIHDLVQRENDLLSRGMMKNRSQSIGQRQRLSNLFLYFIEKSFDCTT